MPSDGATTPRGSAYAPRVRAAAILVCSTLAGACASHPSPDDCIRARDHLIDVRFAANAHDADKLWRLRIFDDASGVMNESLADGHGAVLVVSQFTLYGDTSKGRRPSWIAAARPEHAEPLVDAVCEALRGHGATVATGRFRTDMRVELVNDGPVTVILEV